MSTVHELKCWPIPFAAMRDGTKRFEYRKDDRNYEVGDILWNREWEPPAHVSDQHRHGYTGREDRYRVTYKLAGRFGVPDGFCVLSIEPLAPHPDLAGVEVVSGETLKFVCDALAVTKDRLIKDGASVAPHGSHKRVALAMLTEALGLLGRGGE